MSKTLREIAEQLKAEDKKVQLIYAFNGTGKTRLSREFSALLAYGTNKAGEYDAELADLSHKNILYYNAFTEDLFYWDNDLTGDENRKLQIRPNAFTEWVLKDEGQDQNVITNFQQYTDDKLTPRFNNEYTTTDNNGNEVVVKAFSEVSFSHQRGGDEIADNIKISKGEESNFIWSMFYTLLDQVIGVLNTPEIKERGATPFDQLEYVFIDDPVSSLDENHLIQLAVSLAALIKSSDYTDGQGIKFVITTHNPLFYNVLYNELKVKRGSILSRLDDGSFELESKQGDSNKSFSYHLHIKGLIEQAVEQGEVQRYHFALLRNLYEKTANFLGYKKWSDLLPGDKKAYATRIMNLYPHNSLSNEAIAEPTAPEKAMIGLLLSNLNEYGYLQRGEQND